jgi:hypothetical protein
MVSPARFSPEFQDKVFASLPVSREALLGEITWLLIKQHYAESRMEVEYYEKKYGQGFAEFDAWFQDNKVSYEIENDWLDWKFSLDSRAYWGNLLEQARV